MGVLGTQSRSPARAAGALVRRPSLWPHLLLCFALFCSFKRHSKMLWMFVSYLDIIISLPTSPLISVCDITHPLYYGQVNLISASLVSTSWLILFVVSPALLLLTETVTLPIFPHRCEVHCLGLHCGKWVRKGTPGEMSPCSNEPEVCLHECSQNKQTKLHLLCVCYKLS